MIYQFSILLIVILVVFCAEEFNVLRPNCRKPVHRGFEPCNNATSSIRYHMDPVTLTCLAFKYTGCGGNENNFKSSSECHVRCLPMDYNTCPANSKPIKKADGTHHCTNTIKCEGENVYCSMGFVVGLCCNKTISDQVNANYAPDCGLGKKVVEIETNNGWNETLLGKECSADFCPEKSTCQQGPYFAYCCK
ncbi:hypothetical protein WR25_19440 [Diploscapter pachys]|uniref:BPTI/Kunitz inhibitor domain-containing protein n=1 Tax=Diploscapter pachys TaxID=2018661 RepID=A0A2A2JW71_9BILA|nr:hypothetical protein WR25_19440 [Diploscapter pachys]